MNRAVINEVELCERVFGSFKSAANPLQNCLTSDKGVIVWKLTSTSETVQTSRDYPQDCVAVFPIFEFSCESRST